MPSVNRRCRSDPLIAEVNLPHPRSRSMRCSGAERVVRGGRAARGAGHVTDVALLAAWPALRLSFNRKLSPVICTMWAWCSNRFSIAAVSVLLSAKALAHCVNGRLLVSSIEPRSERLATTLKHRLASSGPNGRWPISSIANGFGPSTARLKYSFSRLCALAAASCIMRFGRGDEGGLVSRHHARWHSANATWVLPTPLGPGSTTFSAELLQRLHGGHCRQAHHGDALALLSCHELAGNDLLEEVCEAGSPSRLRISKAVIPVAA